MSNENRSGTPNSAGRIFELGLMQSALEREAPLKSRALRRLTAVLVASSLSALAAPGCVATSTQMPGQTQGLDNGTVGYSLDGPSLLADEERDAA